MLTSEMDLGMAATLKGVTDTTSAAHQNRLLDVRNYERRDCH